MSKNPKENKSLTEMFEDVVATTVSHTERQAFDVQETVAKAANRGIAQTNRCASDVKENTAKSAARVIAGVKREASDIKENSAKTGARVIAGVKREASDVKENSAKIGRMVTDRSDANHGATREEIRAQHDRTRAAINELDNDGGWGEKFFCFIIAVISGIGMWFAENNIFYRVVEFDKHGNPLRYATDPVNRLVLCVAVGLVIYFIARLIVRAVAKHFR